MNKPIDNGKSWAAEFQPGSRGEKAIESLGLRCDHLRHDLLAMDADRDALAAELAEARKHGAPVAGAKALGFVKHTCSHDEYWTTSSGACMACRAVMAEDENKRLRRVLEGMAADTCTCGVSLHRPCETCRARAVLAGKTP